MEASMVGYGVNGCASKRFSVDESVGIYTAGLLLLRFVLI